MTQRPRLSFFALRPAPELRPWIHSYTILSSAGHVPAGRSGTLVPDGHVELGFSCAAPILDRRGDGCWSARPSSYGARVLDRGSLAQLSGRVDEIAVKLCHGAAPAVLGVPAGELLAECVPLDALLPAASGLTRRLAATDGLAGRRNLLDAALRGICAGAAAPDPLVAAAARWIARSGGRIRVQTIAERLGCTSRTLQLRFRSAIGLSPGRFAQVRRLRRVVRFIHQHPRGSLALVAHTFGYADQSHFNREFRRLVGEPPRQFFAGRPFVSDLLRTGRRRGREG
ncbi:MAG TPA: helix-turn-helix domain-containing protein [Thermoanaerobaculia bacterium]|nr:helix-turn-helix domain-containing protein [Thermoanaerobaculia bacterium]